jgi:hypothetical protein
MTYLIIGRNKPSEKNGEFGDVENENSYTYDSSKISVRVEEYQFLMVCSWAVGHV